MKKPKCSNCGSERVNIYVDSAWFYDLELECCNCWWLERVENSRMSGYKEYMKYVENADLFCPVCMSHNVVSNRGSHVGIDQKCLDCGSVWEKNSRSTVSGGIYPNFYFSGRN